MTDTTGSTATPPAAPIAAAPVAAAPAAPVSTDPIAAVNAKFDALQAQLAAVLAAQAKPGVVVASAGWTWSKTKCGAALVADFYKALDGLKTMAVFTVTGGLALANEFGALDLTPLVSRFLPEGAHIDTAGAIVLMSVAGISLRAITKTPAFVRWAGGKLSGGASDSNVDAPKGE